MKLTQSSIFSALHTNRSPLRLFSLDDGHLWDLAGEIANSKSHRLREKAQRLIENSLTAK